MTTAKNDVFTFLLDWIGLWWGGNKILVGRRRMSKFLPGGGYSPITPVGKILYIYTWFIFSFVCSVFVINKSITWWTCLIRPNDGRSISCSWRNKFIAHIYNVCIYVSWNQCDTRHVTIICYKVFCTIKAESYY